MVYGSLIRVHDVRLGLGVAANSSSSTSAAPAAPAAKLSAATGLQREYASGVSRIRKVEP
jgi:hypothetical protein